MYVEIQKKMQYKIIYEFDREAFCNCVQLHAINGQSADFSRFGNTI